MSKLRLLLTLTLIFIGQESIGRSVGEVSLAQEEKRQEERDRIDTKSVAEVVASKKPDRYTQTEAHLHLKDVRNLIDKTYNVEPYLDLISTIIANEATYKDTHYAFYNTTANAWRLAQDLYTRLYAYEHPGISKEFKFLRFNDESVDQTAQGFLVNELKEKGLVDDNTDTKFIMLSVNLALFGNVGFPGECSWEYFVHPQSHAKPIRIIYEKMMKRFGLSQKHIDEIMKLADIYETKEDTIVQILVPKNKVDEIGYLAWVKGIPFHGPTVKAILKQTGGSKKFTKVSPTMEKLTEKFAKNQNNPLFKDMLAHVEAGDYSLDDFLKVYRNQPWELKEINDVTARLLFTPDVLLNPSSGVKFFRFSTVTKEKLKEYDKKLNALIKKMIAEKEATPKALPKNPKVAFAQ